MRPFSDVDLNAYVDNQISTERREVIAAYLKTAPADAARVDAWRRQNEAIRTVFAGTAAEPVPVWLTIGQLTSNRDKTVTLQKAWTDKRAARSGLKPHASSLRQVMLILATALLAFAAGSVVRWNSLSASDLTGWWAPSSARAEVMRSFSRRALDAHATYSLDSDRPVEAVDLPEGALSRWFKHHLAFPVRIPDLERLGWTLRGGRIVPGDIGPAALLVYENAGGERLSLYTGRVANPSLVDTAYQIMPDQTMMWMDGPIGFGIMTSKAGPWLAANAREVYRAVYGVSDG